MVLMKEFVWSSNKKTKQHWISTFKLPQSTNKIFYD